MSDEQADVKIPTQSTHDVKLEETAKGVRIHVHVYATDREKAITEAIETYLAVKTMCQDPEINIPLAPMTLEEIPKAKPKEEKKK